MQRGDVASPDGTDRRLAQCRQDVSVEHEPICTRGTWLAAHQDMGTHVALGERGHGEFRRRRHGDWRFTALDAVDDDGGTFPRFVRGHVAVVPEGHSLQSARPPGLDHVGLSASGVDTHPEPREVPVPEDSILGLYDERIDGALGESELASPGHGASAGGCRVCGIRHQTAVDRHRIGAY